MDTQPHQSILQADPGTTVRTTVGIPEDLWQAAGLLALRRKCSRDDIFAEALRMLFASLEPTP